MMKTLTNLVCVPCRGGEPTITEAEIAELMPQIPDWHLIEVDEGQRLRRQFDFDNYSEALAFTNQVGALAEQADHHPAILIEWGKVTVTWWTHVLPGLHLNDFILAAKTERLFQTKNSS